MNIQEKTVVLINKGALVEIPRGSRIYGKPLIQNESELVVRFVSLNVNGADTDSYLFRIVENWGDVDELSVGNKLVGKYYIGDRNVKLFSKLEFSSIKGKKINA